LLTALFGSSGDFILSLEENKKAALRYLELLPLGRIGELSLAPDFSGWSTLSGEIAGGEFLARTAILPKMFVEPLKFTVDKLTAEDNRVSVQCRSEGLLITGVPYDNQYHYLFIFTGNAILKVYEYMSSVKAATMFPVLQQVRHDQQPASE
jgi:hypothetical protein